MTKELRKALVTSDYVMQVAQRIYEARVGISMPEVGDRDFGVEAERAIKAAEALQDALVESGHMVIDYAG